MPCSDHAVLLKATARPSRDGRALSWPMVGKSIGPILKGHVVEGEDSLSRKVGTQEPIYAV